MFLQFYKSFIILKFYRNTEKIYVIRKYKKTKFYNIDARRQFYKTPYLHITGIFSVLPYFILQRSMDPFSILQKYGENVRNREIRSFMPLNHWQSKVTSKVKIQDTNMIFFTSDHQTFLQSI